MKYVQKNGQHNILYLVIFSIFIGLTFTINSISVSAKESNNDNQAFDFTMSAELPDNQQNKDVTYFDLKVRPGDKQDLKLRVTNTGKKKKKIRVTPTNAKTNQNGNIDYSIPPKSYKQDSSLKNPFTTFVEGGSKIVDVAPGKTEDVVFKMTLPKQPFKGLVLGGFVADLPDDKSNAEDTKGVKIVNKFQVVKAIMLREDDGKVEPELKLNKIKPALVNYHTAVTANIQNIEPVMFGKLKIDAKITKKGSDRVIKSTVAENQEMAPNSNYNFPIMWEDEPLEAGDYTLKMTASTGDKKWPFTKNFNISESDSNKLNKEAVNLNKNQGFSIWGYVLIALVILLVAAGSFIFYKKKMRNKTVQLSKTKKKATGSSKKTVSHTSKTKKSSAGASTGKTKKKKSSDKK
ncbi:DUF916 and DUF3324 domain-containing protein [Vagococcus vulneris]|uniref:Uncharacterized protein n=1 Tax=Vagococcus vulneris TaxID=1977869 RepID=A0A429ZYA3_9ENTE|nr:DUF916 and DUF3324 domain-containing protein [Vagococcus vulneris]RST98930.1 hypothetical protein CBF37_06055 [Vagococcus vulneris]